MNDIEAIEEAYAAMLQILFKTLASAYIAATGNVLQEQKADEAFQAGLTLARKVRERALALVQIP